MPRAKQDLEKVTIRLKTGHAQELNEFYPSMGYNRVIRDIVENHLKKLRERLNQKRSQLHDDIEPSDIADISIE